MALKRLGAVEIDGVTKTVDTAYALYTVGASKEAAIIVRAVNRTAGVVTVRIAHVDGGVGDLADEDYLEYDTSINGNTVLEITGLALATTESIIIRSNTADVNFIAYGSEDTA